MCGDGPDRARLETLSRELGVAVRFTGMLDQRSLQESYAGADLFAFSSCSEGLPLVLVEAAAAGLPIVYCDPALTEESVEQALCFLLTVLSTLKRVNGSAVFHFVCVCWG